MTDYLLGANQKIPDWVIKITFWGNVEIAGKSGFKSSFDIMGFKVQVMPFRPLVLSLISLNLLLAQCPALSRCSIKSKFSMGAHM